MFDVTTKKDRHRFYNSTPWIKKRKEILVRDNYECQWCKENGVVTTDKDARLIVDHIKELETHPHLALELSNLRVLCFKHHEVRHERMFKGFNGKKNKWADDEWFG